MRIYLNKRVCNARLQYEYQILLHRIQTLIHPKSLQQVLRIRNTVRLILSNVKMSGSGNLYCCVGNSECSVMHGQA